MDTTFATYKERYSKADIFSNAIWRKISNLLFECKHSDSILIPLSVCITWSTNHRSRSNSPDLTEPFKKDQLGIINWLLKSCHVSLFHWKCQSVINLKDRAINWIYLQRDCVGNFCGDFVLKTRLQCYSWEKLYVECCMLWDESSTVPPMWQTADLAHWKWVSTRLGKQETPPGGHFCIGCAHTRRCPK